MAKMLRNWIGRAMLAVGAVAVVAIAALALGSGGADAQGKESVKSLSVGGDHACALTTGGAIYCWGQGDAGQTTPPARHQFAFLSLSDDYSCGAPLSSRGDHGTRLANYICWGSLSGSTPRSFPGAAGITHTCGWFNRDRDRYHSIGAGCGGSNAFGQHDLGYHNVEVGGWHTCKLNDNDGSIQCVGRNDSGQTDVPSGKYVSVDAGREHTCAATDENRLRCWGDDSLGQSSPPGGSDYLEVSSNAFANFSCALTDEKKVRCWGDNRYGQLRVPSAIAAPPPLEFTREIEWINSRQRQPIGPFVLPPAQGGQGRLSYNIAHTKDGDRRKGPPTGLVFDETTRRLSGRPFDTAGGVTLHYRVSDTSGRTEEVDVFLRINGPVPAGLAPAITWPELGSLDRGLIRCGAWSESSLTGTSWGPLDHYSFRLASPMELTIDLESAEADTYIRLFGEEDNWQDDDGGQGTNSRLTVGLPPARYSLYVHTANGGGEGTYTMRIRSPDFTQGNADASRSCSQGTGGTTGTTGGGEGNLDPASAGRITARRLEDGRIEFAWQPEGGERVLPRSRYLPSSPPRGRWLNSSEIVVEGASVGRINVRVGADDGRIEFAFTPTGDERILPPSRYFPADAAVDRWLRSTLIEPGG